MTLRSISPDERQQTADRRPGIIPGRRFAFVLALGIGLLCWPHGVARADSSSGPIVYANVYSSSGTSTETVTVAQLQASSQCPTYSGPDVIDEMGTQGPVDVDLSQTDSWALSTILQCLQPTPVQLPSVQGVTIINSQGSPETDSGSEITPADLKPLGQTDFNNPDEGPVVTALGSANRYDRPWRGSSQGEPDNDFADQVTSSDNGTPLPIDIEVFEGPLLTVTANASRTTVPAGSTVKFSATVTGENGSTLSYSWSFDGGASNSTLSTPQVAFDVAGQYDVTVQVTDAQGGGGTASIPITVGTTPAPASGKHGQKGAGKSRKSHTPTGPKKSGGTHAGGRAGKQNTSHSTTSTTTTTPTTTTPTTSTTATTSTATTPSASSTSHQTPGAGTGRRRSSTLPRTRSTTPTPSAGQTVVGQLISDVTPLPAAVSPLVRIVPAPLATAPPARQAIRATILPELAGGFAVVLLLGLGASRELRGRGGWRALRPGN